MIKPIDETATTTVIFDGDTAIDPETSDLKAYRKAVVKDPGCWRTYIKPKPGEKITQFVIGVIPPNELCAIEDMAGPTLKVWKCFLASLRDIVDGPTLETTDKREVPKTPSDRVDPAWLGRVFGGANRKVAVQIGTLAYAWQQFAEADARP